MNKISTFFKSLFVAGMAMVGTQALAVDWIGSAPVNGGEYYLYNTARQRWLWDTQSYNGSYQGEALSTNALLWTFDGNADATFTLTSANSKQFSQKNQGWANRIETMMTGLSGKRVNLRTGLENGKYSLYFNEREYSGGQRNVNSTSATRLETGRDAAYEWLFITPLEYQSAQPFYFKAAAVAGENGEAQVSFTEGTYTESEASTSVSGAPVVTGRTELQTKAYFHAVPVEGKVFVGWYDNAEMTGSALSASLDYSVDITSTSQTEEGAVVFTLYAKFGDKLQPVITADETDLLIDETSELLFENTTASLEYLVEKEEVISYDPATGVVTALKEGTSRLDFHQPAEGNIAEANISLEFTVSKHTPVIAWAENVYENQEVTIYTLVDGDIELFSAVSSEPMVASLSGEHGTMLKAYNHGGSTIITITATETDYWAGEVFTKEITPVKAPLHVAVELNSAEQYEAHKAWTGSTVAWDEAKNGIRFANGGVIDYDQHEYDLHFEGIPDSLSFTTSTSSGLASATFWVEESVDGFNWSNKIWESTQRDNTAKIALQPTTRYVKLHHNGNYYGYMQDIRISEKVIFEADSEMLSFFATEVSVVTEAKPLVLTHANIGYVTGVDVSEGFEVSLDGENFVESLSISSLENIVTGGDIMGTVTLYVRYLAETAEHVDGELVIYTNKDDAELFVALTGIVGKDPTALDNASLREAKKVLRNGQVFIVRDGKLYDLRGMVIE